MLEDINPDRVVILNALDNQLRAVVSRVALALGYTSFPNITTANLLEEGPAKLPWHTYKHSPASGEAGQAPGRWRLLLINWGVIEKLIAIDPSLP